MSQTSNLQSPSSSGIVCCSSDLCGRLSPEQLPWARLVVGIFVAAQTMLLGMTINLTAPEDRFTLLMLQGGMLAATVVVLAILGIPLALEAAAQAKERRLTMELLFLVGIAASMCISVWSMWRGEGPVYFEVVNVLLIVYSIGRTITAHSRYRAIAATESMLKDVATARLVDGRVCDVTLLRRGDRVRVAPGELIPVDGIVISGESLVRTSAFSGEWQSRSCRAGQSVLAGSGCEDGTLVIEATSDGLDRRIDKLASLIASACQATSPMQRLADRFVRVFLPLIAVIAGATLLYWGVSQSWTEGIFNALAVILVACPCAAGLATPLTTWTAIGRLADRGLILKSADALERLARSEEVIFDKTGTLGDERLELRSLTTAPDPAQRRRTLALIAEVEKLSDHPVARALRELPREDYPIEVLAVRTIPGRGIEADVIIDSASACVTLLRREGSDELTIDATLDDIWIASATFSEKLRETAPEAIERLRALKLDVRIMTGDASAAAVRAGALAPVMAAMTPEQKHEASRQSSRRTLFIGDGVNDAAAMGVSHCSVAMASGAAVTNEAADATLHGGNICVIPDAIGLAREAMLTIRSNFAWAVSYNVIGMTLAATGVLHPIVAAVLMSVSSAIVAYRSFNLSGRFTRPGATSARLPTVAPSLDAGLELPFWLFASLHFVGFLGQALVLIPLARLGLVGSAVAVLTALLAALLVIRFAHRLPEWLDMTVAMLSIGGLGMNIGWWMDLKFDPAIQNGEVMACCMVSKTIELTGLEATTHWMYWMMLIAGVPAMYLLRRGPLYFKWRKWCCTGMLVLGVPGMCFGMWAGAQLATGLTQLEGNAQVVASYLLMVLGMCAGMVVPHFLSLAWPAKQR